MNVKKAFKKVLALGVGSVMMGATVLSAMAADLSDFPAPFVQNGAYNAWIVVGQGAQVPDVIGAIDIATRLQYEMKVPVSTSTSASTVTVAGDATQVHTSTDMLEFGEALDGVKEVYTNDDLNALASGVISNNKGTFGYDQLIDLSGTGLKVDYTDDSDRDVSADFLYVSNGDTLYEYEISFPTALESDVDSDKVLDDIEDKSLTLFGKTYAITSADISGSDITLELMGGDISDTLYEGETKTYTINGKDYEITVSYIGTSDDETVVKFNVVYDGKTEVTSSLASSETYILDDGTELGVRDALEQNDYSGTQKDFVEFYMGSNKITLANGDRLEVGSDSLTGTLVTFDSTGTDTPDSEVTISSITITVDATDDWYVPAGGKLSDELDSDEKGLLFTQNFDFTYEGLTQTTTEDVSLDVTDGNSVIELSFTNKEGNDYRIPILYAGTSSSGDATSGDEDGIFWTTEGFAESLGYTDDTVAAVEGDNDVIQNLTFEIDEDDYFIIGDGSKDDYKRYTYVFKYTDYDADDEIATFTEQGSDVEYDVDLTVAVASIYTGDLRVGGKDYLVYMDNSTNKFWVDMDGNGYVIESDGTYGGTNETAPTLTTEFGIVIALNPEDDVETDDDTDIVFTVDDSYFDEPTTATKTFTLTASEDTTADEVSMNQQSDLDEIGDTDNFAAYLSTYGIYVEQDRNSDYNPVDVTIPSSQLEAQVFLTSGAVQSTVMESDSSGSAYSIVPIAVGAAKLDTEASGWRSNNVIAVGGPCANTVSSEMMGNPSPCGAGFEAGKAKIKLFENSGKVSMLVAGYSAEDTLRATRVVGNYKSYPNFKGSEVEVSGTSMSDITVSAPTN